MTRGRKRSAVGLPAHIQADKLPKGVYWDKSGNGRWYIMIKDATGKARTQRIAGPEANLSDLHRIIEQHQGQNRDSFAHIAERYHASDKFHALAPGTKKDYEYCRGIVLTLPTRIGLPLGQAPLGKWTRPMVQRLVDQLATDKGPSAANHVLRYVRRVFTWALNRGHATGDNPAKGIESATERKQRKCPDVATYTTVLQYAQANGANYLWIIMELAYLCRLRGIEVMTLTDAHATPDGIDITRRKGSRGNLTEWGPRLRHAWDSAQAIRDKIRQRRKLPLPMQATDRFLFLERGGDTLRRSTLDSAWQRMITKAIKDGVITQEQRFSLHDLKRAGITRTEGTWADKQDAGGHVTDAMRSVYDHSKPRVRPTEE